MDLHTTLLLTQRSPGVTQVTKLAEETEVRVASPAVSNVFCKLMNTDTDAAFESLMADNTAPWIST